jgi:hypothetical protein
LIEQQSQRFKDVPLPEHRPAEGDVASADGVRVRCPFCASVNSILGLIIGLAPIVVPVFIGRGALALWALPWTVLVLGYTVARVRAFGYLPGIDRVADATGLSRVVGSRRRTEDGHGGPR